jgi:hypothetical protein
VAAPHAFLINVGIRDQDVDLTPRTPTTPPTLQQVPLPQHEIHVLIGQPRLRSGTTLLLEDLGDYFNEFQIRQHRPFSFYA